MKTFFLNGTEIVAKEFDYNMLCDLEDLGISMGDMKDKSMSFMRAYIGLCLEGRATQETVRRAGTMINNHLVGGGNFEDVTKVIQSAMEDSGFFQALSQRAETESTARAKEKK